MIEFVLGIFFGVVIGFGILSMVMIAGDVKAEKEGRTHGTKID